MRVPVLPFLALTLIAGACSSGEKFREVDSSLLSGLPATAMVEIDSARAQLNFAEDTLAEREKAAQVADKQVELARAQLDGSRSALDEAKIEEQLAEQTGSDIAVAAARRMRAQRLFEMGVDRAELAVAERQADLAQAETAVARETMRTRRAEVELKKAQAVSELDLAEAQAVPVANFEKDLFKNQKAMASATARLASANEKLLEAKIRLNEAQQKLAAQLDQNALEEAAEQVSGN